MAGFNSAQQNNTLIFVCNEIALFIFGGFVLVIYAIYK